MAMIIPPLNIRIVLESNPLKSIILVRRLAVLDFTHPHPQSAIGIPQPRGCGSGGGLSAVTCPSLTSFAARNLTRAPEESHRRNRSPRPQAQKVSKLASLMELSLMLHLSKLVIWGSGWGRRFRFHRLKRSLGSASVEGGPASKGVGARPDYDNHTNANTDTDTNTNTSSSI